MTIIFFQINVVEILFEGRKLGSCNLQSCIPTIVLTSASYRIQTSYKTRFLDTCGTYRNNNILHTGLPTFLARETVLAHVNMCATGVVGSIAEDWALP